MATWDELLKRAKALRQEAIITRRGISSTLPSPKPAPRPKTGKRKQTPVEYFEQMVTGFKSAAAAPPPVEYDPAYPTMRVPLKKTVKSNVEPIYDPAYPTMAVIIGYKVKLR
jgi:hypothetical protein